MSNRIPPGLVALVALGVLAGSGSALSAQDAEETQPASASSAEERSVQEALRYDREIFRYERAGRRDPFRSLLGTADLGVRAEDLVLRGVIVNPDPRQSVAVIREASGDRQFRVRPGDRIGGIRVVAIHPDRVDLVVEELGVARSHTLRIRREQ